MSALGGFCYFDDRPVDRKLLAGLGDKLSSHGPDGGREIVAGSVGMVYRAFHTNRESRLETQPFVSDTGTLLCWDGRLDNREELISLLRRELMEDHTDVAFVMAAYQKFGVDFLPRLIGDFALALWDPRARWLLLARDAAGPRPLYYHANEKRVFWSSELMPLLDFAGMNLEINDEYIAGYLTSGPAPEITPYKNIFAVSPGGCVLVKKGRLRTQRFWSLDPNREIRHRSDAEYEEHFRGLFREAVRCRLRVEGTVWGSLSGGLDSSAIVCMADDIIRAGEAQAERLETVSYVYDEAASSDERPFIQAVEEKLGRIGCYLRDEDHPSFAAFPDESRLSFPDFQDCFVDRLHAMCEAMRAGGARTLLTGHGGDEILCSSPSAAPLLGDLLLQRRFLALSRSLKSWGKASGRSCVSLFWRDGVVPLLPANFRARFTPAAQLPSWFDPDFATRLSLGARQVVPVEASGFALPSVRDQAAGFFSIMKTVAKASYRAREAIEVSHPYLHRPLVEFLQAIPFDQRVRPGESRSLMRRALRNLLPEKILKRQGKKGPEEALSRAVAREQRRLLPLFRDSRAAAAGYIDAAAFLTALERAIHGCGTNSFALIQTISLEFWLRAMHRRRSLAENAVVVTKAPTQTTTVAAASARRVRKAASARTQIKPRSNFGSSG